LKRLVHTLVAAAVLTAAVATTPAYAAAEGPAAACSLSAGSVTAAGAHTSARVTAGTPPTMSAPGSTAGVFAPGQARLSSTFVNEPSVGGVDPVYFRWAVVPYLDPLNGD
jgi:hypothetical protein